MHSLSFTCIQSGGAASQVSPEEEFTNCGVK